MKDIRKGDFVRIAHTKVWPGSDAQSTADIIDYGFIVNEIILKGEKEDRFIMSSYVPLHLVLDISRGQLESILVSISPTRIFSYQDDKMSSQSDVIWKVKSDRDDVVLLVHNPRWEIDNDDDGNHIHYPDWDKITKENGEDLTELEQDTYTEDLRNSLRHMLSD